MKKIGVCLAASVLFCGCTTTKISPDVRNQLNQKQAILKTAPVAMIIDGCLLRNELGTDLIVAEQSNWTAEKFAGLLSQQLSDQGIQVGKKLKPFVCGYMPKEQLQEYDYKADSEVTRVKVTQYPLINKDNVIRLTEQQQNSLLNLNQSFNRWQQLSINNLKEKKPTSNTLDLNNEDIAVLKDLTQANYIFIAALTGVEASFGQKFTAGALSVGISLATVGAGANFVSVLMPREGQHYLVHIVDLDKKEVFWTKAGILAGNLYSTKKHSVEAKAILDPLFEVPAK
ncbi:hypothetical protein [Acinetobacter puyangensis]|uniref:hypothetical protein n=1 Tax=Acinetobacter puyangensis TaxID=1096779 RepID=UPI003A4D2A41